MVDSAFMQCVVCKEDASRRCKIEDKFFCAEHLCEHLQAQPLEYKTFISDEDIEDIGKGWLSNASILETLSEDKLYQIQRSLSIQLYQIDNILQRKRFNTHRSRRQQLLKNAIDSDLGIARPKAVLTDEAEKAALLRYLEKMSPEARAKLEKAVDNAKTNNTSLFDSEVEE